MDDAIATGVFALIGVMAGAFITAATTLYVERRREKRAARAAARLLKEQLRVPITYAERASEERRWTFVGERNFSTSLWEEHRVLLASVLTAHEWEDVSQAFRVLASIASSYHHGTAGDTEERDMDETQAEILAYEAAFLKAGIDVLTRVGGKSRKPPGWAKYAPSSSRTS